MPGQTKHHLITWGASAAGVASRVILTDVRLTLDYDATQALTI
jgi:hypothetical protein